MFAQHRPERSGDSNFHAFLHRICEGTEQIRYLYHRIRQNNACHNSGECSEQRAGQRPARLADLDGHKVDGHRIKDGFRTAEHDGDTEPLQRVGSVFFEDVQSQSGGGGGGKQLYKGDRQEVCGKMYQLTKRCEQSGKPSHKAAGAQDPDRDHEPDECREDLHNDL